MNTSPKIPNHKTELLAKIKDQLDHITDRIGMPLDKGIKETVLYLNALNLSTQQSCQGHLTSGRPYPWILIGANDEPRERYIGQTKIFQKVADKYHVPLEEVERMRHEDGYTEASIEASGQPETADYKAWAAKNKILLQRTNDYLKQFYHYHPQPAQPLVTMAMAGNEFFLQPNISLQEIFLWRQMTPSQKDQLRHNLKTWQAEMQAFTSFLKQQFEAQP